MRPETEAAVLRKLDQLLSLMQERGERLVAIERLLTNTPIDGGKSLISSHPPRARRSG